MNYERASLPDVNSPDVSAEPRNHWENMGFYYSDKISYEKYREFERRMNTRLIDVAGTLGGNFQIEMIGYAENLR